MTIQTLIATMNQKDYSLLKKMNIQTDAIIVNQCDRNEIVRFDYEGHDILWLSLNERGVGLSRNTALMRSTADIVLFGDEDVCYADGYPEIILSEFEANSKADIVFFDLKTVCKEMIENSICSSHRVHLWNSMRFGAVHFTARRERLFETGMTFSLLFGGGAKYSCGEDSIFIADALKKHLAIWTSEKCIGTVFQNESSWFVGYNEKYFYDKGVLMHTAFGGWAYLLTVALLLKNRRQAKDYGLMHAIGTAMRGIQGK